MKVETGVIAAAGSGTRMLPVTLGYPKELLPIINKPAIQLIVDEMSGVEILFEPQSGPYGNGTPLMVARPHIPEGEGFIYAYGDDILKTRVSFARRLVETHQDTGALVAGVQEVPWEDVSRYGVVELKEGGGYEMEDVVEKPPREEAKSNLAMFGRFLLSTDVIQILSEIPLGKSNELWLTDAVREHIRRGGR